MYISTSVFEFRENNLPSQLLLPSKNSRPGKLTMYLQHLPKECAPTNKAERAKAVFMVDVKVGECRE
jgi:hypothetical protein